MSLTDGMGEHWGSFLTNNLGFLKRVIEKIKEILKISEKKLYYCPRCGTNAPLGQRFYAVPNVFYPDTLEVKCATCWDHPTVGEVKKRRK